MIRNIEAPDIHCLARIYYDIFTSKKWNYDWLSYGNVVRYFTDMYNCPKFTGYAFVPDGTLCGACFGDISDYFKSSQYYIKEIFVKSELQSKGSGSKFLREIETDLKSRGVMSVTLYTLEKIPAYKFYLKNGYQDGNGSVFMFKSLI